MFEIGSPLLVSLLLLSQAFQWCPQLGLQRGYQDPLLDSQLDLQRMALLQDHLLMAPQPLGKLSLFRIDKLGQLNLYSQVFKLRTNNPSRRRRACTTTVI